MNKSLRGFTIVELLIVIVIIAILATISIVSFNGIQQRARNTQVIAGVDAYRKAIINYAAVSGAYPAIYGACLGSNYPSNQCWVGTNGTFAVNSGFDTSIAPYIGSTKPTLATKMLQPTTTDQRLGAIYLYTSPTDVKIVYYLEGPSQACGGSATGINEQQTTQCSLALPAV